MDFSFSSDQQLLKNSARAFLDEHCKPATVRLLWDDPRGESESMWKEMAQLGWHGLSLPEAYGGSGLGMVETAILLEELGRAAYPGPYWPTVLSAAAIEAAGNETQKKRWLSPTAIWTGTPPRCRRGRRNPRRAGVSPGRSASCRGRTWPTCCSSPRARPKARRCS